MISEPPGAVAKISQHEQARVASFGATLDLRFDSSLFDFAGDLVEWDILVRFAGVAMSHRILLGVMLSALFCACGAPPTKPAPPKETVTVHWRTMVRDHTTACAYLNCPIRFRVEKNEYDVEGKIIKLWYASRDRPPTLLIACDSPIPPNGPFFVVGVCAAVTRDGTKRSMYIDYRVDVIGARVEVP
jgi:hypothetical protein